MLTESDVRTAAVRIAPHVRRTPLVPSRRAGLALKLENEQRSGSFKARGAFAALTRLTAEQRARGVVTHSSGNHGRALAEAAVELGCPVTVVVPDNVMPHKMAAIERAGARIVTVPVAERVERTEQLAAAGLTVVPPFDHQDVMAGQGTVGLEILDQQPDVRAIFVPVGGGGLLSGIAIAVENAPVQVVGVEPELAGDFADSVRQRRHVAWPVEQTDRTIADGLRLPSVGDLPWQHLSSRGVRALTVSEQQIRDAMGWLDDQGIVAEPSGAVSVAGALAADPPGAGVDVAVVSGGNRAGGYDMMDPPWL